MKESNTVLEQVKIYKKMKKKCIKVKKKTGETEKGKCKTSKTKQNKA